MINKKSVGNDAENIARQYLVDQGLKLLHKNFFSRFGEIDLIMQDGNSHVFVEVRKRQDGLISAIESITPSKQKKLIKAAQYYLLKLGNEVNCRFDVIAIDGNNQINWLKNVIVL